MEGSPKPAEILKSRFGHDGFLSLQEDVVANVLAGRDSLVLMPTGSGKSLCYQLPAVLLDGVTLVVSPLIALMKDQVDALKERGVAADFINSTMTHAEVRRVQMEAYHGRLDILYAAPERIALPRFRDFLHALKLSLIAIDEAHCISEWGHDFRPDYRNLQALRGDFPSVPAIALTATATERVRRDIVDQLQIPEAAQFVASFNRPNLTYRVMPKRRSFDVLTGLLSKRGEGSAIIYCFSRQGTEDLASRLSERGFGALPYHAGLEDGVRRETQERFLRGDAPIIVATIAFGMGVDKPDVRLVVHYDLPKSAEGYYQETGRAGRDGKPSECVLFYSYGDKISQEYFIGQIEDDAQRQNAEEKLARMVEYGDAASCRRAFLLRYFGEEWTEDNCDACDVCLAPSEQPDPATTYDGTEIAQKVLATIIRTGERFGANHVVAVLRGSRAQRVLRARHDSLSVHGIARGMPEDDLKDVIDQLVDKGLAARRTDGDYPTLYVTDSGRDFLKGRDALTLVRTSPPPASVEGEFDPALFEKLRALRKKIADEMNVPAFVVFGDATLRQMASHMPLDRDSFLQMSGVGESKLDQYGDDFIAAIREHAANSGGQARAVAHMDEARRAHPRAYEKWSLEEDRRLIDLFQSGSSVPQIASDLERQPSAIRSRLVRVGLTSDDGRALERGEDAVPGDQIDSPSSTGPGETYGRTLELVREGSNVAEIASSRGISQQTVLTHLERLMDDGESFDITHLLPPQHRYVRIAHALRNTDGGRLKPVADRLGGGFSYEELRLVRLHLRQSGDGC